MVDNDGSCDRQRQLQWQRMRVDGVGGGGEEEMND
jgi:hypothetical protein